MNVDQLKCDLLEYLEIDRSVVDKRARAPARRNFAAQNDMIGIPVNIVVVTNRPQRRIPVDRK